MLWMLLACQSDVNEEKPTATGLSGAPADTELAVTPWSSAQLETALSALTAESFPHAQAIVDGYAEWLQRGDGECPQQPDSLDQDLTMGCSTDSGYQYLGISEVYSIQQEFETSPELLDPDWVPISGLTLVVDCDFTAPGGQRFQGGGHVTDFLIGFDSDPLQRMAFGEISGSWMDGHSDLDWFRNGTSGLLSYELFTDGIDIGLELDGAISINGFSLVFAETFFDSYCPRGFGGTIELRDGDGSWHTLESPDSCDPCAEHRLTHDPTAELEPLCANWGFLMAALAHKVEPQ